MDTKFSFDTIIHPRWSNLRTTLKQIPVDDMPHTLQGYVVWLASIHSQYAHDYDSIELDLDIDNDEHSDESEYYATMYIIGIKAETNEQYIKRVEESIEARRRWKQEEEDRSSQSVY